MKRFTLFLFLLCSLSLSARVIYLVPNDWRSDGAALFVHSWGGGSDIAGKMVQEADNLYKFDIGNNTNCLFVRQSPDLGDNINWEQKWNQTADLTIPADKNCYTITGWEPNDGTWSTQGTVTPPTPDPNATYYVTGNAELVGADKAWSETAISMTKNADNMFTHTFTGLAAETVYRMKITNGTWKSNWGFNAVQNAPAGVVGDVDGNVVFALKTEGDVVVGFNGANITLQGDFTEDEPIKPKPATSVPSACPDVMLQGFYWDSNQDGKGHGNTRWTTLQAQATEIAAYFDLVWLPPSAKSSGGVGYHPKQYNNQNSDWGSRSDLEKLIKTLHAGGAKVIADIVINHIDGKSGWCDYYEQDFGSYGKFAVDGSYICKDDEVNWDADAACKGSATGAYDDGYGDEAKYGAARDLAHNEEHVRQLCRAYTKWMIDVMDYDGFRYDYCKGFHNSHINDYNANAGAYFSVMEYWDGNADVLWSRISDAQENTLTFDFGVKYDAFNRGIASGNYNGCKGPGLLGKGKGKWAVTFVDSHDSYQRDDNEFGGKGNSMKSHMKGKLLQCNAFMLSMPGVPCVFYPHWTVYKSEIAPMILARKAVGVHSESAVSDEGDGSGYRARVTGTNGTLILELGNKVSASQSGYTKAASGDGYAIWIKTNSAVAPELVVTPGSTTYKTETLKVEMYTVKLGSGTSSIYYTLDGTDPKTSSTKKPYTSSLTVSGTVTLKAYAEVNGVQSEVVTCTYTYQPPQTTPLTVKFMPPTSWDKVYLYAWEGANLGSWPGMEWKTKDSEGWLYHVFPSDVREVKIIFTNGAGEQSSDIILDQDACYEWQGMEVLSKNCSLSDIPFQVIASPEGKVYKTEELSVSLSTVGEKSAVTIYYTLDGSDPKGSAKQIYSAPITITGTKTLKAYAVAAGEETEVITHTYTYEAPQGSPIVVKAKVPDAWTDQITVWVWPTGGEGVESVAAKEGNWYVYQHADNSEFNIIFKNGAGWNGDPNQSEDITGISKNTCLELTAGAGKATYTLIDCDGTGVEDITTPTPQLDITLPMYNVLGQKVNATYRGIVIQNGHKYLR